ncbi:MAG TPA: hypothetical protein VK814_02945 [Acidobacteriaceae bacterium]|nr:hypothetical protein [Acidobacteriaceae bacterium]
MSAITDLLVQKTGLSPDKAVEVEQVVVTHVMSCVPAEFQGMLSSAIGCAAPEAAGGQPAGEGGIGSLIGEASSFFGKKS